MIYFVDFLVLLESRLCKTLFILRLMLQIIVLLHQTLHNFWKFCSRVKKWDYRKGIENIKCIT